tara:strand:- start:8520 stop:9458 length:939 start_codon:yes stop_codon:yes gene_type:complete
MLKYTNSLERGKDMKLLIGGNAMDYHEIALYFDSYCKDLVINELSKIFEDKEEAYSYLVNTYNKILAQKELEPYKSYCTDKDPEQKIFSLLLSCGRNDRQIYYATILKISEFLDMKFLKLFLVMYIRSNFYSEERFGTKMIIKKEFIEGFLLLLKEGYEKGLFVSHKTMIQGLADMINNTVTPVKDKAFDIIKDIEDNIEKLDYILVENPDETYNDFDTYKNEIGIDYKEIVLSEKFQEYLEDCDKISYIEELDEVMLEYIEESGEVSEILTKYMLDNNLGCILDNDSVKNIKIDEKSLLDEFYKIEKIRKF